MKTMAVWTGIGAIVGFILFWGMLGVVDGPPRNSERIVLSIFGAISVAAISALFAAVNVIQKELRETRRELKHWQSIQQMDEDLSKPSTHIKASSPSGMK